ncbi:MAG: type II secretion system protein GspL [Hyphomonadaceae bacterium]
MSEFLILIGGDRPDAAMVWARADAEGHVLEQGLAEGACPAAHPGRTVLVLPGAEARVQRVEMDARTQAQARAAAPFLFERALADQNDVHYAAGDAQVGGARLLAAVSRARLHAWLDRCRALGADPHVVVLDCTVWPVDAGEITVAAFPNRVIVSGGELGGFSIEPALAPPVFARWLSDAQAGARRIALFGGDAAVWQNVGARMESRPALDPVSALARGAVEAPDFAPNLRQGEFAPAGRNAQPLALWRFAVLLAAAALLLQIGSQLISGWRDHQGAARTLAAAERDYRALNPNAGRIVNLGAQVRAALNRAQQAGRHPVLAVSAPVVATLAQHPLVRIDSVRHQGPDRRVQIQFSATDQAALEAALSALSSGGQGGERRDLPPRNGRYAAELTIEAPP